MKIKIVQADKINIKVKENRTLNFSCVIPHPHAQEWTQEIKLKSQQIAFLIE